MPNLFWCYESISRLCHLIVDLKFHILGALFPPNRAPNWRDFGPSRPALKPDERENASGTRCPHLPAQESISVKYVEPPLTGGSASQIIFWTFAWSGRSFLTPTMPLRSPLSGCSP
jgi:hypothetical protein